MQGLSRVVPLRDFFLLPANYAACSSVLVQRYGELLRKTWNPRNFKGQVRAPFPSAPHAAREDRRQTCLKQLNPLGTAPPN